MNVSVFSDRRELLARMESALRRKTLRKPPRTVEVGALRICNVNRTATWQGRALDLSPKEFDILAMLAEHCGRVVSRTDLFDHLWGTAFAGEERLIDRHIMKLRQKLGDAASLIETVWGTGYRLAAPAKKPAPGSKSATRGAPG